MKIPFSPPDIGEAEIEEVVAALKSGWITTGPKTKELERQVAQFCHTSKAVCHTSKAVCLNSATAALELTLHQLGIGPGDEVITCAYTYTASASVVCHVGAKLVLVDCQKDGYQMDYDALEAAITEKTKAVIPVDIAGVICDYDRIFEIVEKKKALFTPSDNKIQQALGRVAVVADAAHAFGARRHGKMCGEIADFTAFSFHAVKNFTTAEGGAVVWRDIDGIDNEEIYKNYMLLSLHGQSKDALAKTQLGAWEYDIVMPGYKCNMTDIMAGIGLAQMRRYPKLLMRRCNIIGQYDAVMENLPVQVLQHYGEDFASSGHLYLVRLEGKDEAYRNEFIRKMAELEVATNVHYKPLPMHTAYKKLGFDIKDYPNAYQMYHNEITLPLHTCLSDEEVEYVLDCFAKVLRG